MKKSILFCLLMTLATMIFATDFSEYEFGKKIYKTFEDGRGKWVEITKVAEYDERGNEIHYKVSDGREYWHEYKYKKDGGYFVITYRSI